MAKLPDKNEFPDVSWSGPPEGQGVSGTPPQLKGYEIVEKLGEGGMGIVYLAQQKVPIKRRVALKVIKPGMDSARVIARFEAERQALALLDHPNIARVFDAGTTELGRPYFAMEYVEGIRITDYCDREQPTTEERLRLFIQACRAIQHAHQKGIIHRDIKPSNVLVSIQDDQAIPKIIDFGVAKALGHELTERTIFTEEGQLLGTPAYMSPEQAELTNQDMDTRSDIYSLGVLLYELLTGALPFDREVLREAALGEIQRILREEDPVRPSKIVPHFNSDVEAILFKALAKNPDDRYQSTIEFQNDIQRWLQGRPVTARQVNTLYIVRKFILRHRTSSMIVGLVSVILVSNLFISLWLLAQLIECRKPEGPDIRGVFMQQVALDLLLERWHNGNTPAAGATLIFLDPNSVEGLGARFCLDSGSYSQKEADYKDKILAIQPSFWNFIVAEHRLKEGEVEEAVELYRQVLKAEDESSELDDWFINKSRVRLKKFSSSGV